MWVYLWESGLLPMGSRFIREQDKSGGAGDVECFSKERKVEMLRMTGKPEEKNRAIV